MRVVVLNHTPPVFCAGADLKERSTGTNDSSLMVHALERLITAHQPTIAPVEGPGAQAEWG